MQQVLATDLAASLDVELVNGPITLAMADEAVGVVDEGAYVSRTHLYRRASVLMALHVAERLRPEFHDVLRAFERHAFPVAPAHGGRAVIDEVRSAM